MFCHIVPCVYLKSWKIKNSKNSIYIFDKSSIESEGIQKNISNLKDTGFGEINFYYLKIERCNNRIYDNLFLPLFNYLNNYYIMEFKGKIIKDPGMFRIIYLSKFDDLIIKRKDDSKVIKNSSLNGLVNNLWNDEQKKYIEDFFSKEIENKWNNFLSSLNDIDETIDITSSLKRYIMLFVATQFFRNGKVINIELKNILSNFIKNQTFDIKNELIIDTIFEFIYDYNINNLSSTNIIYNTFLNLVNLNWNYTFYINNENNFLLSDNPIFIDFTLSGDEAIFFTISPKTCLQMIPNMSDSIKIRNIDYHNVKFLNSLIIKNSFKNIAFYEKNIDFNIYK